MAGGVVFLGAPQSLRTRFDVYRSASGRRTRLWGRGALWRGIGRRIDAARGSANFGDLYRRIPSLVCDKTVLRDLSCLSV